MLRTGIVIGLVSVAAVGRVVWAGATPRVATAESGGDTGQRGAALLEAMRGLRADIAALRSDIKELRAELGKGSRPATGVGVTPQAKGMTIEFTLVPPAGAGAESRGNIAGRVMGLPEPEKYKIVLYARTDWWYVQPLIDAPFTSIKSDGMWSNWTHLGYRYAALIVRPSFRPSARTQSLPTAGDDVVAVAEIAAKE